MTAILVMHFSKILKYLKSTSYEPLRGGQKKKKSAACSKIYFHAKLIPSTEIPGKWHLDPAVKKKSRLHILLYVLFSPVQ